VAFSKNDFVALYSGILAEYTFHVAELPPLQLLPEMKSRVQSGAPGPKPSYLSMVNGIVTRHETWSDCEAIVKGRSGAKFKKVATLDEEKVVLQSWGVDAHAIRSK
jgi:hypothetical protein